MQPATRYPQPPCPMNQGCEYFRKDYSENIRKKKNGHIHNCESVNGPTCINEDHDFTLNFPILRMPRLPTCQPATCNPQPATRNLQPATCNPQPATCNLQPPATLPYEPGMKSQDCQRDFNLFRFKLFKMCIRQTQ